MRAPMDGTTFPECANHLAAIVSEIPDYATPRKVSAAERKVGVQHIRGGGANKGNKSLGSSRKGIKMPDGSIWTGYYSDWDKIPDSDKQTVMDTRKKNKTKGTAPNRKQVSDVKSQIAELKRTIAKMKSKSSNDEDNGDSDSSDTPDNAGDAFGGRQKKKQKKE